MAPLFLPGEIAAHPPVSLMQKSASTGVVLLSALAALFAHRAFFAETAITFEDGQPDNTVALSPMRRTHREAGNMIQKVAPAPACDSQPTAPPIDSASRCATARPRP